MQAHFPRPTEPPPIAWFNSEVQEYHMTLLEKQPTELSDKELEAFLRDITSGARSFGLIEEWEAWFLYLLPYVLIEVKEDRWSLQWYEASIAAFMNMHWDGIEERYAGFRDDVMRTLGMLLMDPVWWAGHDLSTDVEVSSIAAASFLCLKYLDMSELQDWIDSIFAIEGACWEAMFVEWVDRFHRFYRRAMTEEGAFRMYTWMEPNRVDWTNSEYLMPTTSFFDFLPRGNVERFIQATRQSS